MQIYVDTRIWTSTFSEIWNSLTLNIYIEYIECVHTECADNLVKETLNLKSGLWGFAYTSYDTSKPLDQLVIYLFKSFFVGWSICWTLDTKNMTMSMRWCHCPSRVSIKKSWMSNLKLVLGGRVPLTPSSLSAVCHMKYFVEAQERSWEPILDGNSLSGKKRCERHDISESGPNLGTGAELFKSTKILSYWHCG